MKNSNKRWTPEEEKLLEKLYTSHIMKEIPEPRGMKWISGILGRTISSVKARIKTIETPLEIEKGRTVQNTRDIVRSAKNDIREIVRSTKGVPTSFSIRSIIQAASREKYTCTIIILDPSKNK